MTYKRHAITLNVTLAISLLPISTLAGVMPSNGNFFVAFDDFDQQRKEQQISLTRNYNSKTTTVGWFGYGWGSTFESRLNINADGSATIQKNGNGVLHAFRPAGAIQVETDEPSWWDKFIDWFDLGEVSTYRLDYQLPLNSIVIADECSDGKIERMEQEYRYSSCEDSIETFDLKGRLTSIRDSKAYSINVNYQDNLPRQITDSLGHTLALQWAVNGLLTDITASDNHHISYGYSPENNLIHVLEVDNSFPYDFEYDPQHNLTAIIYADKSSQRIEYDPVITGAVRAVTQRNGDKTLYEYRKDPNDPQHYWTKITAQVVGAAPAIQELEYKLQKSANGSEIGQLISQRDIVNNQQRLYDDNGLLLQTTNADGLVTNFEYDHRQLKRIATSQGQVIELAYNDQHRLQSLIETNHDRQPLTTLKLNYNDSDKISEIAWPGIGRINFSYRADGEIEQAISPQDQVTLLKINAAFQRLLEVVKTAGGDW